jgi:hypothetical protein
MALPIWSLCIANNRMAGKLGSAAGMRIYRGNLSHCHFVHHKSHITYPGIERK